MGTLINQELYKIFKKKSSIIIPIIIFILMIAMAVLSNNYEDILKPESQFKQGYTGFSWIFFLMIIQAATIITMEFHYGTIKNLLYRNYSRMSIILSKFSALFIYSLVLFIVTTLISLGLKLVLFSDMDILKQSGDNLSLLQEHLIGKRFFIMSRKNIKNQANQNFYMLHKALFVNEKYKKLSDSAKVTYAILNDRVSLSIKNNWVDDNGDIYFIFTNESLQNILDKSKNTITKIKKELQAVGLLEQIRTGFNKPNKLYLHDIETNINVEKSIQSSSITYNDKDSQILGLQNPEFWDSRFSKFGSPESQILDPNDTDYNDTDYIKTENNDTDDLNDNKLTFPSNHTNHSNHDNSNFNNEALKFQLLEELPQSIQNYLSNFEVAEIKIIKTVLLKAKTSFNNAIDSYYLLEDMEIEILHVLKRFKAMLIQKNETVVSMQGYLMKSLKSEFAEMHTLNKRRDHLPITSLFN